MGAQWLSGRVLDWRLRGSGFEPHQSHFVASLSKNINPSLVLVQPRKTRPFITERLLTGCKESNIKKIQAINSYFASDNFCSLTITFANSLDPDRDPHDIGCDLDLDGLGLYVTVNNFSVISGRVFLC